MKVKALRGVCLGVGRHLKAGDIEDLEPALVTFLAGIGAVERVKDEPIKPAPEPVKAEPVKTEPTPEPNKFAAAKTGGKEK